MKKSKQRDVRCKKVISALEAEKSARAERVKKRKKLVVAYPLWKKNILEGDFSVCIEDGRKVVTWPNTNVFHPSWVELNSVLKREFKGFSKTEVKILSGLMSLSASALLRRV
jgi:hypothetical protein